MIQAIFHYIGDKEIAPEEYVRLVRKYGQQRADEMVETLITPGLEQEEKEAV